MTGFRLDRFAPLFIALFAVLCVAVNPVGFFGGGNDDRQYLEAARCWLAQGSPCLPQSHWWTRWPVFAPMVPAIALLGETRTGLGLGALAYWASLVALTGWIGARWFSKGAGLLAATLIAATPVVTGAALQPNADIPELAFQLAALAAATLAFERQQPAWAIAAGVLAAFALQSRDTSMLFVGASALAWLTLPRGRRKILVWAIVGLAGAMLAELLLYWVATGDPLFRFGLAMSHVGLPSDQLPANFDTSQGPLFNPAYIAAWNREMGIEWMWPLDPWINLFASPKINSLFLATALLAGFFAKRLEPSQRRSVAILLGGAMLVSILLVYALAVDPKPRMFMSLIAACALTSGAFASAGLRSDSRALALVIVAITVAMGVRTLALLPTTAAFEAQAKRWLRQYPGQIEIDEWSRAYLTLVREARTIASAGSGKPLRIVTVRTSCPDYVRPRPGTRPKAVVIDQLRLSSGTTGGLCLLKYVGGRAS